MYKWGNQLVFHLLWKNFSEKRERLFFDLARVIFFCFLFSTQFSFELVIVFFCQTKFITFTAVPCKYFNKFIGFSYRYIIHRWLVFEGCCMLWLNVHKLFTLISQSSWKRKWRMCVEWSMCSVWWSGTNCVGVVATVKRPSGSRGLEGWNNWKVFWKRCDICIYPGNGIAMQSVWFIEHLLRLIRSMRDETMLLMEMEP